MNRLLISVCTYNEVENIRLLIPELRSIAPDADILVIDDNSPDGTSDIVAEFAKDDTHVHLMKREGKLGLGTAALAAFQHAIRNNYDQILPQLFNNSTLTLQEYSRSEANYREQPAEND